MKPIRARENISHFVAEYYLPSTCLSCLAAALLDPLPVGADVLLPPEGVEEALVAPLEGRLLPLAAVPGVEGNLLGVECLELVA